MATLAFCGSVEMVIVLSCLSRVLQTSLGRTRQTTRPLVSKGRRSDLLSSIRTMTVGSGIAPDLLTLPLWTRKALAGSSFCISADPDTAGGELHPALRTGQLCRDAA